MTAGVKLKRSDKVVVGAGRGRRLSRDQDRPVRRPGRSALSLACRRTVLDLSCRHFEGPNEKTAKDPYSSRKREVAG